MDNIMTRVYYKLVKANARTIEQIPTDLRDKVMVLLDSESVETTTQPTK